MAGTVRTEEENRLNVANYHGFKEKMKQEKLNPTNFTYFLLPPFNTLLVFHDIQPFIDFWLQVDDQHKERRFLVDWVCGKEVYKNFKDAGEALVVFADKTECFDECLWIMRQLFIDDQHRSRRFYHVVRQFSSSLPHSRFPTNEVKRKFIKEFFEGPTSAYARAKPPKDLVYLRIWKVLSPIFSGLTHMHSGWLAAKHSNSPNQSKKKYLDKLRVAVPHWRLEDRAFILEAVATNGQSCPGTYVQKLIEKFGMGWFKEIAFGKEKFCAKCGQSSFTSKDRLWTCKHCVREGTRPRARYCNGDCQKADWIQHRAEFHSTPACATCGYKKKETESLITCKFCINDNKRHPRYYCSVACQKVHWPEHQLQAHTKPKLGV